MKTEKAEHGDKLSSKGGSVAAHLRGRRPAPTSKKDTLVLKVKLRQKIYQANSEFFTTRFF